MILLTEMAKCDNCFDCALSFYVAGRGLFCPYLDRRLAGEDIQNVPCPMNCPLIEVEDSSEEEADFVLKEVHK